MINAASSDGGSTVLGFAYIVLLIVGYWVPTLVAGTRHVQGLGQIVVVNLFLGWTGVGWVIALVMAFRHVPPATEPPKEAEAGR